MMKICILVAALLVAQTAAQHEICLPTQTGAELLKSKNYSMDGKIVVITGATSGIGNGIAQALASVGANLIILGYHSDKAHAVAQNLTKMTGNKNIAVVAPFDLSSFKSIDAGIAQIKRMTNKIDVLVCDAGLNSENAHTQNVTDDGFEITFQVTFLGHMRLTESLLPELTAAKGRVVNTGSISNSYVNSSYYMGIPPESSLCSWQGAKGDDCLDIDNLEKVLKAPGKTLPFGLGTGNTFYSFFFKTFYTQEFNTRNNGAGVSMYTGHPGLVATAQNGNLNNKTVVKETCAPMGWTGCNCVKDQSLDLDLDICPLNIERGSGGLAWLAAAPKEVIETGTSARFFTLCVPLHYPGNQYETYALSRGEDAAFGFAKTLSSLWMKWLKM